MESILTNSINQASLNKLSDDIKYYLNHMNQMKMVF